jgi:alpha-beta hydrolase superfamily lysophospholipase
MSTYASSPSWQRYNEILKQDFGLIIQKQPHEKWSQIRGHNIHIDEWIPEGPNQGTVILVHGGGGNGRVLAPFADFISSLGWRSLAPDLPGYGLSQPNPAFRWEYEEWPSVVASLAESVEGPVILMGLSVGGMTAVMAAQISKSVAGVITTTLLEMNVPEIFVSAARWRWLGKLSLWGFRYMPSFTDHFNIPLRLAAPMQTMSNNSALKNYFETDPLLGKKLVSSRFFRTMHAYKANNTELTCPLLLAHPGADLWTPTIMSKPAFDRIQSPLKRFRELSNGNHLPLEQPAFGELKKEIQTFLSKIV